MRKMQAYAASILATISLSVQAAPSDTELAVWANEAIVATYTYNFKNFMERQREIAKYFTAVGWTNYSKVLTDSKIPDAVQANSYYVSAVATLPPQITAKSPGHWQAKMPLLVLYKNPQYQQKQTLEITLDFGESPEGQGIRGLSITSLQATTAIPPCQCETENNSGETTTTPSAPQSPQSAK